MIHVIATVTLAPGTRDAYLAVFRELTPLVRREDGCVEYQATVDEPTPLRAQELAGDDAVVVVEKWASVDALVAHSQAPHMAEYRERVRDYVRGVVLQVLRPV
jgi:quinol monooxygenase YgiN